MKYLLDTNTCIRYINGRAPQIQQKMGFISDNDIAVVLSHGQKWRMVWQKANIPNYRFANSWVS